jgi:DNA-binding transcriptional regulator GbsR (MarR family)
MPGKTLQERIYSTFGEVAKAIGYSPIHGRIVGALHVNGGEMALQALARETGYSVSMISISLDLLEVMGMITKGRRPGDRNLYVTLRGDLLEVLKNAIVMRLNKSIDTTLQDFMESRKEIEALPKEQRDRASRAVDVLEKEISRLRSYVKLLSGIRLP